MKILVAPLNWGLGHASRCVSIIKRFYREGHQVILGGDGDALIYLRQHFPELPYVELAPLCLRYSKGHRQVLAMLVAIPQLLLFSIRDHKILKSLQKTEHFDLIVSDNRFGLYLGNSSSNAQSIYITHQLHILLPKPYKWLETIASRLHARVYNRYSEVWVPDSKDHRLSGILSTPIGCPISPIKFIGSQSRFTEITLNNISASIIPYKVIAIFSGLEPHRSILEQEILSRYKGKEKDLLLINGKINNQLTDSEMVYYLTHAEKIIARSGYSTIMDLDALGILDRAELIPTPGQPEQEYLSKKFASKK